MGIYYTVTGAPVAQGRGSSNSMRNEFSLISAGFDGVVTSLATLTSGKGNILGQTWTGTQDFTGAVPKVPTKGALDNTTNAASTAYADAAVLIEVAARTAADALLAPISSPTFAGIPSVPTAAPGTNTTQAASTAFTTALAFATALPAQAGNAGKFITTNGTTASWSFSIPGIGGTTLTGNVTLTSVSAGSMVVTPTQAGLYATEADATTLVKGVALRAIYNAGDFDYGYKNSAGTVLGWLRPQTGGTVGLADNSTAAGIFELTGFEKLGNTANYLNTSQTLVDQPGQYRVRIIALDATRTAIMYGTGSVYCVVYDASTLTFGTAALVFSGGVVGSQTQNFWAATLQTTNQILFIGENAAVTTMSALIVSFAASVITVNAAVTRAAVISNMGEVIVTVGASFIYSYKNAATSSSIIALTVAGTVPTWGAATNVVSGVASNMPAPAIFPQSSTVFRVVFQDTTSTFTTVQPYTVSAGTTLTANTAAVTTVAFSPVRHFLNGNGNIVLIGNTAAAYISKITATTEALSGPVTVTDATLIYSDAYAISASKTLFVTAYSGTFTAYILTDTAGTISVGSTLTLGSTGIVGAIVSCTASVAKVLMGSSSANVYQGISLDVSGASPALLRIDQGFAISQMTPSDRYLRRNGIFLTAGNNVLTLGSNNATPEPAMFGNSLVFKQGRADVKSFADGAIAGLTNSQTWACSSPFTTSLTTGIAIKLMECAA